MAKLNSKLMIDYDDNNSYLDFITEKGIEYYIKSTADYKDYIITFIVNDDIKPVSIQHKNNDTIKLWEYSEEIRDNLEINKAFIDDCIANLILTSKYWLAVDTIEKKIKEYITNSYENGWITDKEYDRKLNQYEDDDITYAIENIQYMIEKEYGENATLAEIKQDSEYRYNILVASIYLRTKHNL
jgi:hypothetical protein